MATPATEASARPRLLDYAAIPAAPPSDAERQTARALLGAVLLNPEYAWPYARPIPAEYWPAGLERDIASAIHSLEAKGLPVDAVTVFGELQGGYTASDLAGLTSPSVVPTSQHAPAYAEQLEKQASRRLLAGSLEQANRRLMQPGADAAAIVADLTAALEGSTWKEDGYGLRFVDGESWQTIADLPREDVFVDLLPQGIPAAVSADPGRGKTFLAIQMAVAAATGRSVPPFKPRGEMRVFLLCGEDSWRIIARRLRAVASAFNISPEELSEALRERLRIVEAPAAPLVRRDRDGNLDTTPPYSWIAEQIRRFKPDLVILDPLAQWYGGDENDAVQATYFVGRLKAAAAPSNATVLVLHHFNKGGQTRGSTAFLGAFRWHADLRPMEEGEAARYGVRLEDARRFVRLEVNKLNDGEIPAPIWLERVTGGVLRESDLSAGRLEEIARHIGAYLDKHNVSLTEREICKDAAGADLREYVRAELAGVTRDDLTAAISHGSRVGLLDTRSATRGRNCCIEVSAPCPF
jgi:replicative DNA helicase